MTRGSARVLRDNAFLVAAVCLPLPVVVFFVLASVIPRWFVPPPAYDLLIRATDLYTHTPSRVSIDFAVRDGSVEAIVTPVPMNNYAIRTRLFVFDHATTNVREIVVNLSEHADLKEGDPPRMQPVEALAGRRVLDQLKAPDGYQLENRSGNSGGLVGELFGMNRYRPDASLVNKGRVITLKLPMGSEDIYYAPASFLGWLEPAPGSVPR